MPVADGIVALTGGPDRITVAYRLLDEGKGMRLLITGVHPDVTPISLKNIVPGDAEKFDCCVDLGRMAENTIGNAAETADWVRRNDYRSVILVTSTYHLPRARLELRRAMPTVEIVAYRFSRTRCISTAGGPIRALRGCWSPNTPSFCSRWPIASLPCRPERPSA